ncbi:hypothetical protein I4F81_010607 [Pyropia yezoensis]|uniref:Uncharacterized protein n=1 Tax=Pyropia yezoensis TaxID=2788 RepID=A0ACC3CD67_PYRYE|nr:hypothetical protein I4F81_010607 [Neopyropia yezoensis]
MGAFLPPPPAPAWAATARRSTAVGRRPPPPSLRPLTTGRRPRRVVSAAGGRGSGTVAAAAGPGDGAAGGDSGGGSSGGGGGGGGSGASAADSGATGPAVAAGGSASSDGSSLRPGDVLDMDWDALASDEDYIVVDSKDVDALVAQMSAAGLDDLYALDRLGTEEDEEVWDADAGGGAAVGATGAAATSRGNGGGGGGGATTQSAAAAAAAADEAYARRGEAASMEYFSDENVAHMPRWAAAAYAAGEHEALEAGADAIATSRGSRRLDAVRVAGLAAKAEAAAKKRRGRRDSLKDAGVVADLGGAPEGGERYTDVEVVGGADGVGVEAGQEDGVEEEDEEEEEEVVEDVDSEAGLGGSMVDCTVEAVAEDYNVPVECVVDLMDDFGVRRPIWQDDRIRDRLMTEEIEELLRVLTTFDALDLNDRYSDRSLEELADLYDIPIGTVSLTAEALGFFLPLGTSTRLRTDREEALIDALTRPSGGEGG